MTSIQRPLQAQHRVWVTIDEAQKCPEIFDQVKILYDQYKDQNAIKFILTGSALLALHRLSAESLAGRIQLYHLSAFNLCEAAELQHAIKLEHGMFDLLGPNKPNEQRWHDYIHHLMPYSKLLQQTLLELLVWGGLPEVLGLTEPHERLDYLANYLQTYLEKDVRAIESITDLTLYRHLLIIIAEQTGSLRDDTRLLQALTCHRDTLHKYRGYLEASFMYQEVHPYINASLKRLVKSPKAYLINNGLISFLQGIHDPNLLIKTGQIGHRLENWFLNECQVWLHKTPEHHSLHYWRTSSGVEIDFVIKKPPHIFPFEVTYARTIDRKKIQNLKKFLDYEPKAHYGIYVYMGDYKWDEEHKILFVPAWAV